MITKTVMQVVPSLDVGGLERVVLNLVQNASNEFRCIICCLEEPGTWAGEAPHVLALGKQIGVDWRVFRKIARLARAEKVDVVHTHNSAAHFYGAIGGKLAAVKVLHTEHGNLGQGSRYRRLNRIAAHFTDFTVAVSEKNAETAIAHEGVKQSSLEVIPNGIDVERFAAPRERTGRRIGTVGRLVLDKNYGLLLRAVAAVAGAELVFVGDGPLRGELEQQSGPRVQFLGQRADIAELLTGFDVFALSSSTEGMSIALLEAMATGCPIVVTAVGGNTELIQHEVTGLVVPPENEMALRAAIERLLMNRALAFRLGEAARERARQRFSVKVMTQRYEELWRRLAR